MTMPEKVTIKPEEITVRKFWKEGQYLYCDQVIDGTTIMDRCDIPDPNFTEGELRKHMNERMDNTISYYQQHGKFPN